MANTAFDHASALTLPGSTTINGLVRWGDTSAGSFGNITGITSDGSNLTLLTRGEIRFSDADSTHYIALESPATVSTSYTMALPAAVPSANDYLKVTSYSGGAGVLEWASVSADTNTTYSTSWVDSSNDAILRLTPSTGSADDLTIVAGSNITLTPSGDNLTIAASGGADPSRLGNGSASAPSYSFSGDTDTGIFLVSAGNIGFSIGSNEKMRLNSNGGLLINETTHANSGGGSIISKAGNNNDVHFALKGAGTTIDHGMTTLPNQNTDCEVDDYLIIQPNHNLKGGVYNLALAEDSTATWVLETITNSQDTSRNTNTQGMINFNIRMHNGSNGNYSSSMSSEAAGFVIKRDGVTQYIFNMSGEAYADTTWSTFSDGRLKLNQAEVPYGLDTVLQMQPKIYDKHSGSFDDEGNVVLSDTKKRMLGFVAQEVKALAPELVTPVNEDEAFYGLDNGRIVPILVKAIQELNSKVTALGG